MYEGGRGFGGNYVLMDSVGLESLMKMGVEVIISLRSPIFGGAWAYEKILYRESNMILRDLIMNSGDVLYMKFVSEKSQI